MITWKFKKITVFIVLFFSIACNEKVEYFNEQNEKIPLPKGFKYIKFNVSKDASNNLYFVTESNFLYDDHGTIKIKKQGMLLQDSIYSTTFDRLSKVSETVDINTYEELDKNSIYKDKNYVYFNSGSERSDYPVYILDVSASDTKLLSGGYIKDRSSVYHYGFQCLKLEHADAATFDVVKLRDTVDNSIFYIGKDKNHLYRHDSEMAPEDLRYLRIGRREKDFLVKYIRKTNNYTIEKY